MSRIISVDDIVISKSATDAVFRVRLSEADPLAPVTAKWTLIGLTAASGADAGDPCGLLTFAAGAVEQTISVPITNRRAAARTETLALIVSSPSANAVIGNTVAIATLIDCDAALGTPTVTIDDPVVDASMREATFVVTLDRPSTGIVSMRYATQDSGAVAGSDYVATSGSLNFAPGETVKTVRVTLLGITGAALPEAFSLVLSALTGATTLDPVGTAIIASHDAPQLSTPNMPAGDIVISRSGTAGYAPAPADRQNRGMPAVDHGTATRCAEADCVDESGCLAPGPGVTLRTMRLALVSDTSDEPSHRRASLGCIAAAPTPQRRLRASRQRRRSATTMRRRGGRWYGLAMP
ncbi:MAG TPA: Calx-beta domain-containing protein [Accumulibacter sp.]|uniref:Calx-beta domain-containing protein n=1 Tax=Accumulibacter sp. TaxID=2053492 RepID=UPI002CB3DBD5|nr:Calx-beta domain-containing protein [Accumulibacter sp.]HRD90986.1 Calx-beta domain-containing protein [Accumulibacter sp.]